MSLPDAPASSFFSGATGTSVNNSTMTVLSEVNILGGSTTVNVSRYDSIWALWERVVPRARDNVLDGLVPKACFPGTRGQVLSDIEEWLNDTGGFANRRPILWLTGPAGSGKSAIVQSASNHCAKQKRSIARYFFRRGDMVCHKIENMVATTAFQLVTGSASMESRQLAMNRIRQEINDRIILSDLLVDEQLLCLFRIIQCVALGSTLPVVLFIDGLDEWAPERKQTQVDLLSFVGDYCLAQGGVGLKVLVSSRYEAHLRASFEDLGGLADIIRLDSERYHADDDIRLFVAKSFSKFTRMYPFGGQWPTEVDIDHIVAKSSPYFLFAAATLESVFDPVNDTPPSRLKTILRIGHSPPSSCFNNCLPLVDNLYNQVLSTLEPAEYHVIRSFLGGNIILASLPADYNLWHCMTPLNVGIDAIGWHMRKLAGLAEYDPTQQRIKFHHASFPDYLRDEGRANQYYIDVNALSVNLVVEILNSPDVTVDPKLFGFMSLVLANVNHPTSGLTETLRTCAGRARMSGHISQIGLDMFLEFLKSIQTVYSGPGCLDECDLIMEAWLMWSNACMRSAPEHILLALEDRKLIRGSRIFADLLSEKEQGSLSRLWKSFSLTETHSHTQWQTRMRDGAGDRLDVNTAAALAPLLRMLVFRVILDSIRQQ